jgi:type IV secretory pathway TraG/TraD family ATPase VirD4
MNTVSKEDILSKLLFLIIVIVGVSINIFLQAKSAIGAILYDNTQYLASPENSALIVFMFVLSVGICAVIIYLCNKTFLLKPLISAAITACVLSIIGRIAFDLIWMFEVLIKTNAPGSLNTMLNDYFSNEWQVYFLLIIAITLAYVTRYLFDSVDSTNSNNVKSESDVKEAKSSLIRHQIWPLLSIVLFIPQIMNAVIYGYNLNANYVELDSGIYFGVVYCIVVIAIWVHSFYKKEELDLENAVFLRLARITAISSGIAFSMLLFSMIYVYKAEALRNGIYGFDALSSIIKSMTNRPELFLPVLVILIISAAARQYFKKMQFNQKSQSTSGNFGSAKWMTESSFKDMKAYEDQGSLFGKDDKGRLLRCLMKNRTIIAAPGGGKSAGIVIPALLTEDRPVFVNDIRGELWAVTARQRAYGFGRKRKVVAIDPFRILSQPEYKSNKQDDLIQIYTINPFDYISKDELERDRDINALISSLVVRENDHSQHWDDNAEIFLAGLVDFILKESVNNNESRNLLQLHNIMKKDLDGMKLLLEMMFEKGGYSSAAASQILKTAPEERGSIYSTTYRQLKWLVDTNMQRTFAKSNFDLREFVKGDMDIFIVIPEDQVVFHQRVFRMMFTLVTNMLSQTSPSNLPKKEILFVLDELGQYGYCKDVERAIEILRARGAVVWALFQSYGQIKLYKKPDLFTNAKIKQIFEVDDEDTMKWIQALGGKKTVLTKTLSTHIGDSRHKMQAFGGHISRGEGENVQETGVDLIHINQIRELSNDEQFVFIRGEKAIKCKRLLYFNDPHFIGKYDKNPLIRDF